MSDPTGPEWHVVSLVVRRAPERADEVRRAIGSIEGAEIHTEHEAVVILTIEAADQHQVADRTSAVSLIPGVFSAAMVFQQSESLAEEANHGPDTPDLHQGAGRG